MSNIKYIANELERYNDKGKEPTKGRVNAIEGTIAVLATKKNVRRKFFKTPVNKNDVVIIDGEFCQKIQDHDDSNVIYV